MKHIIFFLLLLSCLAAFTYCDSSRNPVYVIGVSQCSDDLWRETMNAEMLREASFYQDMELVIKTVKDDTRRQIEDIEELIKSGVDLLVVSPNESDAITPVVERAYKAGIPVVLVDRKISSENYTAYVGADNYQIGREAGNYIAGLLDSFGNVVEIRGWNGSTSDEERHMGFMDAISDITGIKVVASRRGDYLPDIAREQMNEILRQDDSRIDLVFAFNDPMAVGVYEALINFSGRQPYIVGIDALPGDGGGISAIEKGIIDASLIYPTGGDKVMELAYNILSGKPYERENILYTGVVDKSNVRVISLQTEQIVEHQAKLDNMNRVLNRSLIRYSNQRTLFFGTIAALFFISISLIVSYRAYMAKSKANRQLEKSNEEIRAQARVLEMQKNQLLTLSKELEEATHAKLVFFTNISHELKTPLTLIKGPAETLLASEKPESEKHELLNIILRNSERLHRLITQLIEFRSYENEKMKADLTPGDIVSFLDNLGASFTDLVKRKKIGFSFSADTAGHEVLFDPDKLEKIYYNLLSNAIKHTEDNGNIEVKITSCRREEKDYVSIRVFNTGDAVPEEHINQIFERFYKVNQNDPGTGIGLAFTKALVDVHKGFIEVESLKGQGTAFIVLLPSEIYNHDRAHQIKRTVNEQPRVLTDIDAMLQIIPDESPGELMEEAEAKPSVLVIDDNDDIRNYLRAILRGSYKIFESPDGISGIAKARELIPDIVISDIMMPGMDGFEVCTNLKQTLSTSHIPVLLLTACNMDEQRITGYESGADAYIQKPFNAEMLKVRLRKLIESRQKLKESYLNFLVLDKGRNDVSDPGKLFLRDFQGYVEASISEPDLNIDDIAGKMNLSRSQLYRKIKSLTNYSPVEVVKVIRLRYAESLLQRGHVNVSEVAYSSGFSSPSYFTKCFKEFYKKSPSDYIKNNQLG